VAWWYLPPNPGKVKVEGTTLFSSHKHTSQRDQFSLKHWDSSKFPERFNNPRSPEIRGSDVRLLFEGKSSLEEVFAEIEIATVREEFRKAQLNPEQIPTEIKRLIALPDYPAKLVRMVAKSAA
jgi:hypothetical protein